MCDIFEPALAKALTKAKAAAPHAAGKLETAKVDVSKEAEVQAAVEKLDAWGGLDVIFNNAGIMHGDDAGKLCSRAPIHLPPV
jgi:NAD(P)-dependent dehydrogenase (short-subunit alcohol dehydrogenase family)